MPSSLNPPIRLESTPSRACLHPTDGKIFSVRLQAGRMAANSIGVHYPNLLEDQNRLVAAYSSPVGMMVLTHLSGIMYSYWDAAPSGPSAFELTVQHLLEPYKTICRAKCAAWGSHRLNSPTGKDIYILEDTPDGSIVADHTMTKFYKVLGLKISPAAAISRSGISLPATARLTALPFRGVLVYDGLLVGGPQAATRSTADKLFKAYAKAKQNGKIITGFRLDSAPSNSGNASAPTVKRSIHDLSTQERNQVDRLKSARKRDKMVVARRMGYTERENPNHAVVLMCEGLACGTLISQQLVPSKEEILGEIVKLINSSNEVPSKVAVDDKQLAEAVNEVTKHAGVMVGFYPKPSPEEQNFLTAVPPAVCEGLREFDGTSVRPGVNCEQQ